MKTFFITLFANIIALVIVGAVGFYAGTTYIDGKLGPLNETVAKVSAIVETGNEKLEELTTTFESSVGRIDAKLTDTSVYQRIFPNSK